MFLFVVSRSWSLVHGLLFMVLFAVSCSWYIAQSPAGHHCAAGGLTHQARMGLVGRVRSHPPYVSLAALASLHDAAPSLHTVIYFISQNKERQGLHVSP